MAALVKPFSPFVTGPALYLLTRSPPQIQQTALDTVHKVLSVDNTARLIKALKWLFIVGVIKKGNNFLNQWAGNGFKLFGLTKGWEWESEIAVVTGGSSGFGALFAKDLSDKGIHVVVLDVNELPKHLQDNPKISFYKVDVTDAEAVKEVGHKIESNIGHPSILINNAGIGAGKPILDTSSKYLNKIFGVNLFSHFFTVQAFLPDMVKKRKGHVVNIASMASFVGAGGIVDYACTKAGAMAFHEGLRSELHNVYKCPEIKTTVVHPIWASTPLIGAKDLAHLKKTGQTIIEPQTVSDAVVKQILSGRGGQIILPPGGITTTISILRALPLWISESLRRGLEAAPPLEGGVPSTGKV